MSEGHLRGFVNALKVLEWDPMYEALDNLPENPTPESLLGRLCSLDVPSDMPAFKERYVGFTQLCDKIPETDFNQLSPRVKS